MISMAAENDGVLIGGRRSVTVEIVDYDPGWATRFDRVAMLVRQALGANLLSIEHIGSTSVPGLAAKPVVDALLLVPDVADEGRYWKRSASCSECVNRIIGCFGAPVATSIFTSMSQIDQKFATIGTFGIGCAQAKKIDPCTLRGNGSLPCGHGGDMNDYAEAKSDVVAEILARARRWRTGHAPV